MAKFITRPQIIEALQFTRQNWSEIQLFTGTRKTDWYEESVPRFSRIGTYLLMVPYKEAELWIDPIQMCVAVSYGDWVLKLGDHYQVWTPERFHATYIAVEDTRDEYKLYNS